MATEPTRLLPPGALLDGRYEIADVLGRGGMASVYRARDRRLDRPVAVKVLDGDRQDAAGSAFREDRLTARLAHPHIVGIYDSGATPDGRPFLVMELIEGEPVSQLAPLPLDRALEIAADVAAAVAYAHEQGVVHCDIKPQNVLLDAFGRARLTDFGVASADAAPVGEIVYGSAGYIAPERLRGAPTSPAVDIYALGGLLYFLIAGRPPYAGHTGAAIIEQVRGGPPPPLTSLAPDIPPAVDAIVRRAMAPDPADRFPSAAALREAIARVRREAGERTSLFTVAPGPPVAPAPVEHGARPAPAGAGQTVVLPAATPAAPAALPASPVARSRPIARGGTGWLLPLLGVALALLLLFAGARWIASRGATGDPATVAVPALEGLTLSEAYGRLLEGGLTPGLVDLAPGPGEPANVVVYQDPTPGEEVDRGTPVNFVIRVEEVEE